MQDDGCVATHSAYLYVVAYFIHVYIYYAYIYVQKTHSPLAHITQPINA
jgi:hypothetical protein